MIDDKIIFYQREKLKFNELLNKLQWSEDCLLNDVCFLFFFLYESLNMN